MLATEAKEPELPIERTEPREQIERTEFSDQSDHTRGSLVTPPEAQRRENGGYRSVTSRKAYASTRSHQRPTPTT